MHPPFTRLPARQAIHLVVFLLAFYAWECVHGDFHFEFAIEHLLVLTFDPLILRYIRFFFNEFRHLHGVKYRVEEHDAWKDLLRLTNDAIFKDSMEAFCEEHLADIAKAESFETMYGMYMDHFEATCFGAGADGAGGGAAAGGGDAAASDDDAAGDTDQPSFQFMSYLVIHAVLEILRTACEEMHQPARHATQAFFLPLMDKLHKFNYAELLALALSFCERASKVRLGTFWL
jgi:hypothetical protein